MPQGLSDLGGVIQIQKHKTPLLFQRFGILPHQVIVKYMLPKALPEAAQKAHQNTERIIIDEKGQKEASC